MSDSQFALYAIKGALADLPEEDRALVLGTTRDAKAAIDSLPKRELRYFAIALLTGEMAQEMEKGK